VVVYSLVDIMAEKVQQDFQILFKSYKNIKKMSKELGTTTDSPSLRQQLQQELNNAETITNRMMGDIARIDNRTKREKLQTQLTKTKKEIEVLRKDIEKEQRLNSISQANPYLYSDSNLSGNAYDSEVGRSKDQSIEFQSFHGDQKAAEEREAAIFQIQKDTELVAEVFQDLQDMVEDQAAAIDDLEANVEQTAMNVQMGRKEVDKAAEYQKAKRKKMCYLLLCLLVAGGIMAGILAMDS